MSTDYKLTYFNAQGRGEIIRLVLTVAGVPFEDKRIDDSQLEALRKDFPFGQVPVFEFGDVKMCQSYVIARYLARKYKLAGKTELDEARADMIVACIEDAAKDAGDITFHETDPVRQASRKKEYIEQRIPAFLTHLEALLAANKGGKGYFVGDSLTWADLNLVVAYGWWELMLGLKDPLSKHPKLNDLYKRVIAHPKLAPYIAKRPKTNF